MEIWVTSDHHFGHCNIIKYGNRPFKDVHEMDETMIDLWNQNVKSNDHVYHLGDVTMARCGKQQSDPFVRLILRLKGHKRLLLGNHDHFPVEIYREAGFEKVRGTGRWFEGLLLSHYPVHPGSLGTARANVHGHVHQNPSPAPVQWTPKSNIQPYINVSVEVTEYRPITLGEINTRILTAIRTAGQLFQP